MSQSFLPMLFPHPSQSSILLFGGALVALIVFGMVVNFVRRRIMRRAVLAAEWHTVGRLIQEKEFSKQEEDLLRGMIQRRSPETPLDVVATRHHFDKCVDAEMRALQSEGDEERFKEVGIVLREIRVRLELDYVPYGQRIYMSRELAAGQEIWMAAASGGGLTQWTKATIMAVDEAYVHVNANKGAPAMSLARGDSVRCHLWRDDDARYELKSAVAQSDDATQTWSLLHPEDLRRVQARDYYRVRYDQETSAALLASMLAADEDGSDLRNRRVITRLRGRIISLSAGGLAMVTQHTVHTQALLRVGLEIPDEQPFETEVSVVGVDPISGGRHLVRGAFVGMPDAKRDVIARYVMRRQRPLLAAHGRPPREPAATEQEQAQP